MRAEEYLGRAIPARRNVFSKNRRGRVLGASHGANEAEVGDFNGAVAVEEDVGGFEVAVQEFGAVEIFYAF